ncbi:hypothetical protein M011DRAFT_472638, partial [Sporormia fimetaria CBS 119925]
ICSRRYLTVHKDHREPLPSFDGTAALKLPPLIGKPPRRLKVPKSTPYSVQRYRFAPTNKPSQVLPPFDKVMESLQAYGVLNRHPAAQENLNGASAALRPRQFPGPTLPTPSDLAINSWRRLNFVVGAQLEDSEKDLIGILARFVDRKTTVALRLGDQYTLKLQLQAGTV